MTSKYQHKRPTVSELLDQLDELSTRLDQIHSLSKALESMVGYDAKKEVTTLLDMIVEKSDIA